MPRESGLVAERMPVWREFESYTNNLFPSASSWSHWTKEMDARVNETSFGLMSHTTHFWGLTVDRNHFHKQPDVLTPGIEPGSLWWEARALTTQYPAGELQSYQIEFTVIGTCTL